MKNTFVLLALLILCLGLPGCQESKSDAAGSNATQSVERTVMKASDLEGRYFSLQTADGADMKEKGLFIVFEEGMQTGAMGCNLFRGTATLKDGTLVMPHAASTRRMCGEDLINNMDVLLQKAFTDGAQVSLIGDTLTLAFDGHSLVYQKAEKPQK